MNLQLTIPALVPPTGATWDVDPFPTYVGVVAAPAPPPLAPVEGGLLDVDEALDILDLLLLRRRSAAEPPTVMIQPARSLPPPLGIADANDDEALDLDLFCASFEEAPDQATGRELGRLVDERALAALATRARVAAVEAEIAARRVAVAAEDAARRATFDLRAAKRDLERRAARPSLRRWR